MLVESTPERNEERLRKIFKLRRNEPLADITIQLLRRFLFEVDREYDRTSQHSENSTRTIWVYDNDRSDFQEYFEIDFVLGQIKSQINLDELNSNGDSLLHTALRRRWCEGIELLLFHGADPETKSNGYTPWEYLEENGRSWLEYGELRSVFIFHRSARRFPEAINIAYLQHPDNALYEKVPTTVIPGSGFYDGSKPSYKWVSLPSNNVSETMGSCDIADMTGFDPAGNLLFPKGFLKLNKCRPC